MSSSNCCFLACIQLSKEVGQVIWYFHLFQNFPQFIVMHTVKDAGVVSKAEIDVFLELSCFFHDPAHVSNLISGSSAFSKTSLNIWTFTVHILLKPETLVLWPPHAKSWLIEKDSDAGRDWGQEEKGTTEDWDGWMTSPTRWMWVWVNSWSWWWTGRPGVLQSTESQWVGRDWGTEMSWAGHDKNY